MILISYKMAKKLLKIGLKIQKCPNGGCGGAVCEFSPHDSVFFSLRASLTIPLSITIIIIWQQIFISASGSSWSSPEPVHRKYQGCEKPWLPEGENFPFSPQILGILSVKARGGRGGAHEMNWNFWTLPFSCYLEQGLGITHLVNTAEGNKSANVTLDVDQLEANGINPFFFFTILITR